MGRNFLAGGSLVGRPRAAGDPRPLQSLQGYWSTFPVGHLQRVRGAALAQCHDAPLLTIKNMKDEWFPVSDLLRMEMNDIPPIIKKNLGTHAYHSFMKNAYRIDFTDQGS